MFVLLLTMTCNQHNGIQILYNIYVSVSNKYLVNVVLWLLTVLKTVNTQNSIDQIHIIMLRSEHGNNNYGCSSNTTIIV